MLHLVSCSHTCKVKELKWHKCYLFLFIKCNKTDINKAKDVNNWLIHQTMQSRLHEFLMECYCVCFWWNLCPLSTLGFSKCFIKAIKMSQSTAGLAVKKIQSFLSLNTISDSAGQILIYPECTVALVGQGNMQSIILKQPLLHFLCSFGCAVKTWSSLVGRKYMSKWATQTPACLWKHLYIWQKI